MIYIYEPRQLKHNHYYACCHHHHHPLGQQFSGGWGGRVLLVCDHRFVVKLLGIILLYDYRVRLADSRRIPMDSMGHFGTGLCSSEEQFLGIRK